MPRWCALPKSSPAFWKLANGTSRASSSAPRSPDRRVPRPRAIDAPRARTGRREIKEDEAVEDRRFAHVHGRGEAHLGVNHPVSDGHFSGSHERGGAREQTEQDQYARDEL